MSVHRLQAPDDKNSNLVFRFGVHDTPGAEHIEPVIIPLAIDRLRFLALNPVAAARVFQAICENIFEKVWHSSHRSEPNFTQNNQIITVFA